MRIRTHRGTKEIGGTCVKIEARDARVESMKGKSFRQLTDFRKSCAVGNREQELVNGLPFDLVEITF